MGKRGPQKEPVELKLLKGTRQPHRDPAPTATDYGIPPNPFDGADSPAEHDAYDLITKAMIASGTHIVLTMGDFGALEAAAIAYCRARQASEAAAQLGLHERYIDTKANGPMPHPYFREEKACWKEWRAFAADLGLSPSARASVSVARSIGATPANDDPLVRTLMAVAPMSAN